MVKLCLPPIADAETSILILGSLPGDRSLQAQQYYAHPGNQFWRLMELVTGLTLSNLAYQGRIHTLKRAGIGLWDVVAQAKRSGSLDQQMRMILVNNLTEVITSLPRLKAVAFNGGMASRLGRTALPAEHALHLLHLPSSSPAYTLPFEQKLGRWTAVREFM